MHSSDFVGISYFYELYNLGLQWKSYSFQWAVQNTLFHLLQKSLLEVLSHNKEKCNQSCGKDNININTFWE